jgi:hypothetical protein
MSVKVNPPPQLKIPDKFFNDPEVRAYFERQNTILFQLWQRTGGPVDSVAGKQVAILVGIDTVLNNTAYGALIVIEADTADVTITLPQPTQDDVGEPIEFVVIDATFNTTIKPASGTINGQPDLAMNRQYQDYPLTSITTTQWVIAGD